MARDSGILCGLKGCHAGAIKVNVMWLVVLRSRAIPGGTSLAIQDSDARWLSSKLGRVTISSHSTWLTREECGVRRLSGELSRVPISHDGLTVSRLNDLSGTQ